MSLSVIVLAAGRGTRMNSNRAKVMHTLAGKPMLAHVLEQVYQLAPAAVYCVVGHEREQIMEAFPKENLHWVMQEEMLGTAHAVLQAIPHLNPQHQVLVLYGDVPLISAELLKKLLSRLEGNDLSVLTAYVEAPFGLGRIVRDSVGNLQRIVEEKDATQDEREIDEINTGVLAAQAGVLPHWLPQVKAENKQGEYYLPDVLNLAILAGRPVASCLADSEMEVLGVNTRSQLARAERIYQQKKAEALMAAGVTLLDPARFDLRGELVAGQDVSIAPNVLIEGQVFIGDASNIEQNVVINNAKIGKRVKIRPNCVIEGAEIGDDCVIGPFARIRPGTVLKEKVHIGNFVEVKQSQLGEGSKANHLTYLGDAVIGPAVNIGAGTITCNYDGANKHQTTIEAGAFIGSNTALVAPVTIGEQATVAAGSTITKNVSPATLAIARTKQSEVKAWKRPRKGEKK